MLFARRRLQLLAAFATTPAASSAHAAAARSSAARPVVAAHSEKRARGASERICRRLRARACAIGSERVETHHSAVLLL
jgi:hypothetical protein